MQVESEFYVFKEHFRDIKGYEGQYQIGDRGTVISLKSGARTALVKTGKSRYVCLSNKGEVEKVLVSYLVARAFIPNAGRRPYVRHLNGDAADNRASNLEWSETRDDPMIAHPEIKRPNSPKSVIAYNSDGEAMTFKSIRQAAAVLGISHAGIIKCLEGKYKTSGGYTWRFR